MSAVLVRSLKDPRQSVAYFGEGRMLDLRACRSWEGGLTELTTVDTCHLDASTGVGKPRRIIVTSGSLTGSLPISPNQLTPPQHQTRPVVVNAHA